MTALSLYATDAAPTGGGVAVDPHDVEQLAEPLKTAVKWLMANGNVTLTSGRRSTSQQYALRGQNGCAGREMDRGCKGSPTTAIPGTSKHEKGEAADLGGDLAFVRANAARLGIYPAVPGEPWHWQSIIPGTGSAWPDAGPTAAGAPLGAAGTSGGGGGGLSLTDGHTYIRLLLILGGAGLVIAGGAMVVGNTKTGRAIATVAALA